MKLENLLDQYLKNIEEECNNDINLQIDSEFKNNNYYTIVEQDDDGGFFIATYPTIDNKEEVLFIYTSEEEIPYGCDYMDISYDDLIDLLSGDCNVSYVLINNDSHNLYFKVASFINNQSIFPLNKNNII